MFVDAKRCPKMNSTTSGLNRVLETKSPLNVIEATG